MWPDKNGKSLDRQKILREDGTKYYWFPYILYVYIKNNTFFPVDESKIWNSILIIRTLQSIEFLHFIILVSFCRRRIIEFDFHPTKFNSETLFPLTFVMENLITWCNDTRRRCIRVFLARRFQIWAQIWLKMELSFKGWRQFSFLPVGMTIVV